MKKGKSILDFVCKTPLKHLANIHQGAGQLFAKMEYMNPSGSHKDRTALSVVTGARRKGILKPGQTVAECTSGNMGAGLAIVCAALGHPFYACMSMGNSPERRRIMKAFGATVELVPQVNGRPGVVTGDDYSAVEDRCEQLCKKHGFWYVDQFNNKDGVDIHYKTTGKEIYEQMNGKVDIFVTAVGSGGTFVGVSSYLKEQNPNIKCYAVEPYNAAILSTGKVISGDHIVQGTGYSRIPPKFDWGVCDGIITVTDEEVQETALRLSKEEGCYVGYSSAANVAASLQVLAKEDFDTQVATILYDTAFKYSDL